MPTLLSERARTFLSDELRFGVLGTTSPDGSPHLTVMWYELQGDTVMMNTAAGRVKDGNLRRDARVALCVEHGYDYVTLWGSVELDDDQAVAQADIAALAHRYTAAADAERMIRRFQTQQRITLRMRIDRVVEHFD